MKKFPILRIGNICVTARDRQLCVRDDATRKEIRINYYDVQDFIDALNDIKREVESSYDFLDE